MGLDVLDRDFSYRYGGVKLINVGVETQNEEGRQAFSLYKDYSHRCIGLQVVDNTLPNSSQS